MGSNSIIPETACADSDLSSSQTDALLNVHGIAAVTARKQIEQYNGCICFEWISSFCDGSFEESNYHDSLLTENMSDASSDD
ncbi:unnamed protein product [Schistosoma mattheei]|uniref:Uncharacterized protein n=1 Tax=Schistosoma mattheei TaxID=31246 RepID=A0A183P9V6_9TREM|nr:unnamed protein product [Schistosoma mattheei]